MNIGKRIAKLRAENDMSQQTLADLLFVSRDLVPKWEVDIISYTTVHTQTASPA